MKKFLFKMPIGDWSNDGHGKCDYFLVSSDMPIEEVREAHFKIKEKFGIELGDVCSKYEDAQLDFYVLKKLVELGFDTSKIYTFDERLYKEAIEAEEEEKFAGEEIYNEESEEVDSCALSEIWLFLLNQANPNLNLEFKKEDKVPMLTFYGSDEKGRHINSPGYGCFYS